MKKIVITGGSGFIGSHLAKFLRGKQEIHLLVREKSSLWRFGRDLSRYKIHFLGVENRLELTGLFRKISPDIVYHLASSGVSGSPGDVQKIVETNIIGTTNLLEACRQVNPKAVIYAGTCFEYGQAEKRLITEITAPAPFNFYGYTKLIGTILSQIFFRYQNLPIVIVRPFTTYGPYEDSSRFIARTILRLLRHYPPQLSSSDPFRNFVYINDLIVGLIKSAEMIGKIRGEIINLGNEKEYRVSTVASLIQKLMQTDLPPEIADNPKYSEDNYHWAVDYSKAQELLHWKPKISLREGLYRTITWYKKNAYLYDSVAT